MSKEKLMDAISYLDLELIEKYIKEKQFNSKNEKKYWNWKQYSAVAAIVCVLVSSILVMFSVINKTTQTIGFTLPVAEEYIVWLPNSTDVYDKEASKMEWRGLNVSENLYSILQDVDEDAYLAVIVRNDDVSLLSQFEFQGKKYADYQRGYDELVVIANKLEAIAKEGEYLKYGDVLYIDGAPDGTKWSKEYYDERFAFYGSEFIDRYIKDEVFLSVDVKRDITKTENDISEQLQTMKEAVKAYDAYNTKRMQAVFKATDYCVTSKNDNVYLFITKKDFAKLNIDNVGVYDFYSASLLGYKGEVSKNDMSDITPSIKDDVVGFEISKMYFDTIDDENFVVNNDSDVIVALNRTINKWKNTYDSLEFTFYFYSEEVVNEEWFEGMNYVEIWQLNFPKRIVVEVAYENINAEALKELSRRKEISSIHISNPRGFESDIEPNVS